MKSGREGRDWRLFKMYLARGFMLKKKLLSLITKLVVVLYHLGVINLWKKLNRRISLEVLNMSCFLLDWKYHSHVNKLPSLLYQRRGADSKIDSKFFRSSHRRGSVKKDVFKILQISLKNASVRVSF